jgi:hypothetical protein
VRLEGGTIEIFDGWLGWDADAIIDGAETIEGLPFARLEDVQAYKLHHGRPKDLEHVRPLLRQLGVSQVLPVVRRWHTRR